ncbi:YfbU family protein [Gluconobacter japonicus]|uniref:YfbU family protein n=1 Tax=Gluconobacter japonicus TaxID=376620 RepID=UPI0039EA446B
MPPKSERFELRLDEAFLARVDAWRFSQPSEPSRAEAVRSLVEMGLQSQSTDSMNFSNPQKLMTVMLAEIHRAVVEKPEIDSSFIIEAMCEGDYWAIPFKHSGIFPPKDCPPAIVDEVIDILDMCDFLESSIQNLSDADKERLQDNVGYSLDEIFVGFDGNNEAWHVGVAQMLAGPLGRFSRFKKRDFNSHSPTTLGRYRRMLPVFLPLRIESMGRQLPYQAIERITEAGYGKSIKKV